jgi:hypothetical protein
MPFKYKMCFFKNFESIAMPSGFFYVQENRHRLILLLRLNRLRNQQETGDFERWK